MGHFMEDNDPHSNGGSQNPQQLLGHLVRVSGAMLAILITREGTVLAEFGANSGLNTTALAALVAGMYSATREVARIVGERQFSILLQQGEARHIQMSLVGERAMLVVLFEDYQRIGRVRHEAQKTSELLANALQRTARIGSDEQIEPDDFKRHALNLVDRIFAGA
jgi:predicted regulator of Ras-like GTPase activity (Roadblock/LC7/MglB family)